MAAASLYRRKWLLVRLPLAALAVALCAWLWTTLLPLPPSGLSISTGLAEGVYYRYGQSYAKIFETNGVTLDVLPSQGAEMNLQRLRGQASTPADLAFVQGGTVQPGDRVGGTRLETIARVDTEPVWIFTRVPGLDSLEQFQGLRAALGPRGSGTRRLSLALLEQVRLTPSDLTEYDVPGSEAAKMLAEGKLDVVVFVQSAQSQLVRTMLRTPGVSLVQLRRAAALIERMPSLQIRLLPQGAIDPAAKLPPRDTAVLVTVASLVARESLHPALKRLAAEAAREVHGAAGPFHRPGEFPHLRRIEFPASVEARRTLMQGRPWLEEHLPFWWAQIAIRVIVICLPIALLAYWMARAIPAYLRWLLESSVARWYGELKFIEHDLAREKVTGLDRAKYLQRLASIEKRMATFPTPRYLMPRWFTLRQHIDFVRTRLYRGQGR